MIVECETGKIVYDTDGEEIVAAALNALNENKLLEITLLKDNKLAKAWTKLSRAIKKSEEIKRVITLRKEVAGKLTEEERNAIGIDEHGYQTGDELVDAGDIDFGLLDDNDDDGVSDEPARDRRHEVVQEAEEEDKEWYLDDYLSDAVFVKSEAHAKAMAKARGKPGVYSDGKGNVWVF